jgi:hypothetical protein
VLLYFLYFRNEAIPLPNYGLKKSWLSWVIAKDESYLIDSSVDTTFRFTIDIFAPKALDDHLSGNQCAPASDQQDEQIHGDTFQLNRPTLAKQLVLPWVELEFAET